MSKKMEPLHIGLVAAGAVVCVIVAVVVLALYFTGNLSIQAAQGTSNGPEQSGQTSKTGEADTAPDFSTVSMFQITTITDAEGTPDMRGWIGTYTKLDNVADADYALEIPSGETVLAVWKKGSGYFVRYSMLNGQYVKYINGNTSTWLSTEPTTDQASAALDDSGIWSRVQASSSAAIGPRTVTFAAVSSVGLLRRARLANVTARSTRNSRVNGIAPGHEAFALARRGAVKTSTAAVQATAAARARPRMPLPQINPPRKHSANDVRMR